MCKKLIKDVHNEPIMLRSNKFVDANFPAGPGLSLEASRAHVQDEHRRVKVLIGPNLNRKKKKKNLSKDFTGIIKRLKEDMSCPYSESNSSAFISNQHPRRLQQPCDEG